MMIQESLTQQISDLQIYQNHKKIKDDHVEQSKLRDQYKSMLRQNHELILALSSASNWFGFLPDANTLQNMGLLYQRLKQVGQSDILDKNAINDIKNRMSAVQTSTKKQWLEYYVEFTKKTLGTLKVISQIEPMQVDKCINQIQQCSQWSSEVARFGTMKKGMEAAQALISNLALDDEVVHFLEKMNAGCATFDDLNQDVLIWLQTENLTSRVKLSFS